MVGLGEVVRVDEVVEESEENERRWIDMQIIDSKVVRT